MTGQQAEVLLQSQFVEVETGGFQETVFEIVQVEENALFIEFRLWVAHGKIEVFCTLKLQGRQLANGAVQQFLLFRRVVAAGLAPLPDGVEERRAAQVGLQIAKLVVADGQHLGDGQSALREMT